MQISIVISANEMASQIEEVLCCGVYAEEVRSERLRLNRRIVLSRDRVSWPVRSIRLMAWREVSPVESGTRLRCATL